MGNMSVTDAGSLISNLNIVAQTQMVSKISNTISSSTKSNSGSFGSIMNSASNGSDFSDMLGMNKAEGNPASNQKKNSDRIAGENNADARKTSAADKRQDRNSKVNKESEDVVDELSEEDIEKAQETLGAAASMLMQQIENILGMSPEEIQGLLDEMGIAAADLLDSQNLSAFALAAMGEEDSLSLLTNESQYEQFQKLQEELAKLLQTDSGVKDLDLSELKKLMAESQITARDNISGEDISSELASVATSEGATLGAEALLKNGRREGAGADADGSQTGQQNSFAMPYNNLIQNPAFSPEAVESYADTREIANQILDYMKANIKPDMSSLEMQLHPASLGNIRISLENKEGMLTANFVAQNEQVKAALESQMVQLTERFEEQGIKVNSIEVSVAAHSFEQNLEQDGHRQEEQEAQRPRQVRRLQLMPGMGIEDLETVDDETRIAAEMMAANGGTMDVQA